MTIQSGGVVLKAVLRIGAKAGFQLSTSGLSKEISALDAVDASAGFVTQVWVDIAQLKMSIKEPTPTSGDICELRLTNEYVLGIGGSAGAFLKFRDHEWGPYLEKEIPIHQATLQDICIKSRTTSIATPSVSIKRRQAVSTRTTVTEVTYTAVKCLSTGMINCPASLQTMLEEKVERTLTATLTSSGAKPIYTTANIATTISTIAFGKALLRVGAISGSPVSYVPEATSSSTSGDIKNDVNDILNATTGGVSNKMILGVSLGVGIPVLIAIIAGFV